jgi:predicted HTH transcriptional regulator
LEIPETVLEELLQNALVHIDLLKTAAIRLMVFDDRLEIVNPGCVMGGHTIDEVKLGNSYARNPLMANFCAKTMPYRGLGSGIPRVLAEDSHVEFIDSKEGNQFTVRVSRPLAASEAGSNTEKAVSNDEKAVSSGKKAVSNDEKAVSSGKKAVSNDEKAVSSGKKAVSNDEKAVSKKEKNEQKLLAFCKEPKTLSEICEHLGMTDRYKVKKRYIDPLLNKSLRMTEPESPKSPTQKYVAI